MKKSIHFLLIALFTLTLGACAKVEPRPDDGMIDPGDKIGDFTITKGEGEDFIYVTQMHCAWDDSTQTESCEQPVGTKVNVSQGIFANRSKGLTLDEVWSGQIHEMTIEGRPVNLQAFGTAEFTNPVVGTVRVWNVVIASDKPGTIAARSNGVAGGESWTYTAIITFTAP